MMRKRHAPAFAAVLLLHGAALWALQHGLLQRTLEPITSPEMLVEIMSAAQVPMSLRATLRKPDKAATAAPEKPVTAPPKQALASPLTAPVAVSAPQNTSATSASPAAASASTGATASAAHTSGTANPAPVLQQPSSDADYLNNPKPSYPAMSRRLGEQGNVVVHTLIGADGVPQKAEILRSSGFERLDRAALETALKWRYLPGKRAGVAEAMWFKVPLRFVLD
jgi:protein TonB